MTSSTVIVIGGGILTAPLIRRAREMGIGCAVFDGNPQAPGLSLADHPVVASTRDIELSVERAKELHERVGVDGVLTAGADVECTVAAIAAALGLPGASPESARLCNDKAAMRRVLADAGVPGPGFCEVSDPAQAADRARNLGLPIIVKPIDNCGSRGVVRVDSLAALIPAVETAIELSRTGTALIEEFIEASTHTVEMIVHRGRAKLCSVIDTHHGFAPYAVELRHENPSTLSAEVREQMYAVAVRATEVVGIREGPAKVDFLQAADGPRVMEMTARLSGGFHCQYTTPLALGTDNLRAALDVSLGRPPRDADIEPSLSRHAICQALFPKPGRITALEGLDAAREVPGVEQFFALAGVGDVIPECQSSADRRFFVIAAGDTKQACRDAIAGAGEKLRIDTEPVP